MEGLSQRRIRHISSIQIRNLTAFPVRDAFASALSQPAEQPQFVAPGHFSDDLDLALSRKRSRRISTNSNATYKSVRSDESDDHGSLGESRGRRQSRLGSIGPNSASSVRFQVGSTPSVRGHRPRTSSMTSSLNLPSTFAPNVAPFAANLPDHSQTGLEKVIKSRLFETFLTASVEPTEPAAPPTPVIPSSPSLPSAPPRSPKLNGSIARKGAKPSPLSPTTEKMARRDSMTSPSRHAPKSPSISSLRPNGKVAAPPQSPRKSATPTPTIPPTQPRSSSPTLPDYLSPVHRPSTNPSFSVEARSWRQTPDAASQKLKLELWGRIGEEALPVLGKGKEKEKPPTDEAESDWRVLEEWSVDLEQLVPLSEDVEPNSLATIFPIDLRSPPDLLYTILDVPLPIPLAASDPAPPLSLASHKDVTEDAVATALGFVAQVVQLLAAYLGKGLVYPITCIGSRSMIRDGISAMVGPRMFPLFSKGVDTYRFEYGVFLLNKDIELLMADRDLRALDMRHTLPNLKNLLLTLTDGEGAKLGGPRAFDSPELSVAGLESPRAESPVETIAGSTTPKAAEAGAADADGSTPPASGATTPTTTDKKSASAGSRFMLSPIAGFLRARYPSAIRTTTTTKPAVTSEDAAEVAAPGEQEVSALDDEDDRRTIRGDVGTAADVEGCSDTSTNGEEKLAERGSPAPPATPTALVQ
ncbi:hypothetical protein HMN09_00588100 [Mycena chlorophos]|uniref:Uncharacterized protein n=1 Tax=Mycena chlorophos TaxID=658473 RepID=A0A8H6T400_MYCCL|nr:hypothetical protein HMN09_00588100 [Mycena chlorophos]